MSKQIVNEIIGENGYSYSFVSYDSQEPIRFSSVTDSPFTLNEAEVLYSYWDRVRHEIELKNRILEKKNRYIKKIKQAYKRMVEEVEVQNKKISDQRLEKKGLIALIERLEDQLSKVKDAV